jgi:hypothetical protein
MNSPQIEIGRTVTGKSIAVNLHSLQNTNIIAGLKYTGKIQLVKSILRQFVEKKIGCLVLDTEGLFTTPDSLGADWPVVIRPGVELRYPVDEIDTDTLLEIMKIIGLDDVAINVLFEKIQAIGEHITNIDKLRDAVREEPPLIRGQINRGLYFLERTKLIADKEHLEAVKDLRKVIVNQLNEGRVLAVDFAGMTRTEMKIVFKLFMSDIRLSESGELKSLFLLIKEPHLYLSSTELEDFTLRTIRLGLWKFYITNTPQRLPELIVRQADNLFCFYLGLQDDIKHLAPAARMSTDAFQKMVSVLTSKEFLATGRATDDGPLVLQV